MDLQNLIYRAEALRNGETDVMDVNGTIMSEFTWPEIQALKEGAKTHSSLFGDVLLVALSYILAEPIDAAAIRLLEAVDAGKLTLFAAYSQWLAVVRKWEYDTQEKDAGGLLVWSLRYFLTFKTAW